MYNPHKKFFKKYLWRDAAEVFLQLKLMMLPFAHNSSLFT